LNVEGRLAQATNFQMGVMSGEYPEKGIVASNFRAVSEVGENVRWLQVHLEERKAILVVEWDLRSVQSIVEME
jgi:hypothetical protein